MVATFRASGCFGVASVECLVWQFMKVLLVAMGEMAAAGKAHVGCDCSDALQPQSIASLWIQ